jgi:hypothetical protein
MHSMIILMYKTCMFTTLMKCLFILNCELRFVKTIVINKDNEMMSCEEYAYKRQKDNVRRMTWLHHLEYNNGNGLTIITS